MLFPPALVYAGANINVQYSYSNQDQSRQGFKSSLDEQAHGFGGFVHSDVRSTSVHAPNSVAAWSSWLILL